MPPSPQPPLLTQDHDVLPDDARNHGEVFTRRWVVEFILDLVGYRNEADLASMVIVEPACGAGAFLIPIVERLLESCRLHGVDVMSFDGAVRAFDLLDSNVELARKAVAQVLVSHGHDIESSEQLARNWVRRGDFLLMEHEPRSADLVVGNPPYIRLEDVPKYLTDAYRRACPSMRGRSDVYIGFIEQGARLLKPGGALGFICADRWMHNEYGSALRDFITSNYAVDSIVTMHDVDAFEDEVSAYPAVVIIRNSPQGVVRVIDAKPGFDSDDARAVAGWTASSDPSFSTRNAEGISVNGWFMGSELWPSGNGARQQLVADLEKRFPALEESAAGTRVGIGVATGCDEVFITRNRDLVEADRMLPLVLARDTGSGTIHWSGTYLVNPWDEGGLVDLHHYPQLRAFLESHESRLRNRHVAKCRPKSWYRTIDRIDPALRVRPKLLLPDIKARSNPVFDPGRLYPHHNLYFIVSDEWDLEVLGGILLSDLANAVIGAYCVKMRGGTYRFQAQYLRRMRVPDPSTIPPSVQQRFVKAFRARDVDTATDLACSLYQVELPLVRSALES